MEIDEFKGILEEELDKEITASQVFAAAELQNAERDISRAANIILKQSVIASVGVVFNALNRAGMMPPVTGADDDTHPACG